MAEEIQVKLIEDEVKKRYLDYSMSVITGRALPDVKDGLKPVQRRILYSMWKSGTFPNKPYVKSARIVGNCMGRFHPHGDMAIYDTLVRMAQDFSLRNPLIDGQGNWGSVDGDGAASMRYTEARLTKISEELLQDLDKKTVDFIPNFDGSTKEPIVLPAKFPNLLVNGVTGIAVGMATNMPPHNMKEVIDATLHFIDNKECTINDLMRFIKGPDFPTGALIVNGNGIKEAYETGRGKITIKAKAEIEKNRVIVTEIPYMLNKSLLLENIANLVRDKRIEEINDIRDESDRRGMRIVFELKRDANPEIVLNKLYKYSQLQETFGVISIALVNNEPKVLNLKDIISLFVDHRKNVVTKRTQFELKKSEERAHILSGLKIALQNIDNVVELIKKSDNPEIARNGLIQNYNLTEVQANSILEMKLQRLTNLEQNKINDEFNELIKLISELKIILGDESKIYDIIKNELIDVKNKYGDERRTQIVGETKEFNEEELIKEEDVAILLTNLGYIKRMPIDVYKQQKRGGKGVIVSDVKEEDVTEQILTTTTHNTLLMFSNLGRVYWLKAYEVPEASRYARGDNIKNILKLSEGEKINTILPVKEFDEDHFLIMITKKGTFKKIKLNEFSRPRSTGIIAINLNEGDELVQVRLTPGNLTIILGTKNGNAVRFNETNIRPMGRNASGLRGVKLKGDDEVIGMEIALENANLLTITENGYGKRTIIPEYRLTNRGGSGVRNINVTDKTGKVVGIKTVMDDDEVLILSEKGIAIRVPVKEISSIGRNTQGVRVMKLDEKDKVSLMTRVVKND
ncbi:DNA gyrase subunit A [Candidatus Woesearchaeota archaeon]|nr:DNA gyrase subunit A [Candidatus Woesearchaeota archaeon]